MHRWGRRCCRYRGSACVDGEVERSGRVECVDEHVVVESCPSDEVVALGEFFVEDDVVEEFVVEEFVEDAVEGGLLLRKSPHEATKRGRLRPRRLSLFWSVSFKIKRQLSVLES